MPKVEGDYLDFDDVWNKFDKNDGLVGRNLHQALNIIHYMHDKYSYEAYEMALHDVDVIRTQVCGIAGISIVADSFAAMKYGKVKVVRDENGIIVDYICRATLRSLRK